MVLFLSVCAVNLSSRYALTRGHFLIVLNILSSPSILMCPMKTGFTVYVKYDSYCRCHLGYLTCYTEAFSHFDLLAVMCEALAIYPDSELELLFNCLRFSTSALTSSSGVLAVQVLGSLLKHASMYPSIQELCTQCVNSITAR